METPLLAADGDTWLPSLSSGPSTTIQEESEFSRLLAKVNPHYQESYEHDEDNGTGRIYTILSERQLHHVETALAPRQPRIQATLLAGTFCLLHIGFVWGAYFSDKWSQPHVQFSVELQSSFSASPDLSLKTYNLASFMQDLAASRQYLLLFKLWITALLLPCTFMVACPSWIVHDFSFPSNNAPGSNSCTSEEASSWNLRGICQMAMRFSLSSVYMLILWTLVTSCLDLQWTKSSIQFSHRPLGGLAAYCTGMICALGAIVVLRSPPPSSLSNSGQTNHPMDRNYKSIGRVAVTPSPQPRRRLDPEPPAMTVLEEPPEENPPAQLSATPSTPDLIDEQDLTMQQSLPQLKTVARRLSLGQKILVFEWGLLASLVWIPTLYLPLFRISYSGFLAELMTEASLDVYLWDIPARLLQTGRQAHEATWILVLLSAILWLTTVAIPLIAAYLCAMTWLAEGRWSTGSKAWVYALYPAVGSLVFALTLLTVVHALLPLCSWMLQATLCRPFAGALAECLVIQGTFLAGTWFYVAEAILLEIFIVMTLQWSPL